MAKCTSCRITVRDDTEFCPLCGTPLEKDGTEPKPSMYPNLILKEKKILRITQMILLFGCMLELLLVIINLVWTPDFLWCVISGTAILYLCLVLYTTSITYLALRSRFLYLSLGLILVGISVDAATGFHGWALSVALPIQILFMNVVVLVLYLQQKREFQQYLWMSFLNLLLCGIALIAYLMGYRIFFGLMLIAFPVTGVILAVIMILEGRETPEELKRRFHP
ncbi:MAG: DUF6320 domain-containing protein [Lachnospiraceae bacterium]|nr:DUF6320 domain-containing protein [Lachnospiraceae bacterium]